MFKLINNERGSTLLYVVVICVAFSSIGFTVLSISYNNTRSLIVVEKSTENINEIQFQKNEIEAEIKLLYASCLSETYNSVLKKGTLHDDFETVFAEDFILNFKNGVSVDYTWSEDTTDTMIFETLIDDLEIVVKIPKLEPTEDITFYLYDFLTWRGDS
ncbi:MAG: hypothetical protein R3Y12_02015 [Clostridia bacterium]